MVVLKAYRYRFYPNKAQEEMLVRQFGMSRFVYNHFLRQRIDFYAANKGNEKKGLTYHDTALMLTQLKQQPEYKWLQEGNSQALQQALRDLDTAYNNFFNKRSKFPRFKSKRSTQAFRVPQGFVVEDGKLRLPKIGWLKVVMHRPLGGTPKGVTIKRTPSGRYYASVLCEVVLPEPPQKHGGEVGIDVGLKSFMVTSMGEIVEHPKHLRKAEKRLKRLQRRVSRRVRGSRGRDKARRALARQHEKVADKRQDFLHKVSRRLVDENQVIYAEDLNVRGMMKNHNLAKSIGDSGWGEFYRQLAYKSKWYGSEFYQIHRFFPSSKRCHVCGYVYQDLQLSEREWICSECGTTHDRDKNAAINIEIFGHAERTAGTAETYTPMESCSSGYGYHSCPRSFGWNVL